MLLPFVKGADADADELGELGLAEAHGRADGGGVLKLPMTPLAARSEREARFPKAFEEVADFPWYAKNPAHFGQARNFNLTIYKIPDKLQKILALGVSGARIRA